MRFAERKPDQHVRIRLNRVAWARAERSLRRRQLPNRRRVVPGREGDLAAAVGDRAADGFCSQRRRSAFVLGEEGVRLRRPADAAAQ